MNFDRNTGICAGSGAAELCRRTQNILGHAAKYYLFELCRSGIKTYSVRVFYNGERASCCLGRNRRRAFELFYKLADGGVTPLTLADVAADAFVDR